MKQKYIQLKAGDTVECIGPATGKYTLGRLYKVVSYDKDPSPDFDSIPNDEGQLQLANNEGIREHFTLCRMNKKAQKQTQREIALDEAIEQEVKKLTNG